MTAVPQNQKYHTTFGYIKNNNTLHQIQRYNVTLFNFSISNIDITSGTLSVICDTVTDEQIIYTLDLEDDKATLSTDIFNYCVGGTVEMFLSIVWCLYRDVMEIEYDDEPVDPTDERILLLQARVEQLTADLEAAQQSSGGGSGSGGESTTAPNILTLGDNQYAIEIISVDQSGGKLYHKIKDLTTNQFITVAEAGFTQQNGPASFADSNGNTIQYELCFDGQLQTTGYGAAGAPNGVNCIQGTLSSLESGSVIGLKATITNNNETISTAYTTYTLGL